MGYEHQLPKVKSATANAFRSRGIILLHLFVIVHSEGFHPKSTLVRYEQEVKIKQPVLGKEANRKARDLRVCKLSQQINSHLFKSAFIFLEKKQVALQVIPHAVSGNIFYYFHPSSKLALQFYRPICGNRLWMYDNQVITSASPSLLPCTQMQ